MKWLFVLMMVSFSVLADAYADIEKINGRLYIKITNYTENTVYCYVSSRHGYHEFTVEPNETSRHYHISEKYEWGCH